MHEASTTLPTLRGRKEAVITPAGLVEVDEGIDALRRRLDDVEGVRAGGFCPTDLASDLVAILDRLRGEIPPTAVACETTRAVFPHVEAWCERHDIPLVKLGAKEVRAASELAYRSELAATGCRVSVLCPDDPGELPPHWTWLGSDALTADAVLIATRHAPVRRLALIRLPVTRELNILFPFII